MLKNERINATLPLLIVVGVNYLAQVPYYFHQYYIGRHIMPSWPGVLLLSLTLLWFMAGYASFVKSGPYGRGLLASFLVAQVLFYGHAIVYGLVNGSGAVAQLQTKSPFLFVIFLIGYINFAVAAYYLARLLKRKNSPSRGV